MSVPVASDFWHVRSEIIFVFLLLGSLYEEYLRHKKNNGVILW